MTEYPKVEVQRSPKSETITEGEVTHQPTHYAKPINGKIKERMFHQTPFNQERPDSDFLKRAWHLIDSRKDLFIIGHGSLGSVLSLCFGRMRLPHFSIDMDCWNERNYWNSIFPLNRIGYPKCSPPTPVEDLPNRLLERPKMVITTTDSIESRKWAFENIKPEIGFVDIRAGAVTGTLVSSTDAEFMVNSLPDPENVEEPTCSEKGSMYHSMIIAGVAAARAVAMLRAYSNEEAIESCHEQLGFAVSPMTHVIIPS